MQEILFYLLAALTLIFGALVVANPFSRNPVTSAMFLVLTIISLAGLFVLLHAFFLAAVQVIVYAGAVMVLFLFVIMLLSLTDTGPLVQMTPSRAAGALAAVAVFSALIVALKKLPDVAPGWTNDPTQVARFGTIQYLGEVLYTKWLFPFEAVSLLLLVAIVGAVVVAKPRI